jgi:2-keto-3-deoxy-L-rhamnonate aldolase RhmA
MTASELGQVMLLFGAPTTDLVHLAVHAGYSSVVLDGEHAFVEDARLPDLARAARAAGGRCLLRLPLSRLESAPRAADSGIDGFLLTEVTDLDQVRDFRSSLEFPPAGKRSVNPFVPAVDRPGDVSGMESRARELELWLMCESRELLTSLDDQAQRPESLVPVTGLVVGPYDLSAALDTTASPPSPELVAAVSDFGEHAQRLAVAFSIFCRDVDQFHFWVEKVPSLNSVILGYDRDIWYDACRARIEHIRSAGSS